jgi:hypothetical protein
VNPPMPFLRDPSRSERPHSSERIGVHKGARAAQFAPERCHSPSHTALSKLLYMPHLALGWVAFLKRHTDDAVVEYQRAPDIRTLLPPTAILAQRWPSTGSRTEVAIVEFRRTGSSHQSAFGCVLMLTKSVKGIDRVCKPLRGI